MSESSIEFIEITDKPFPKLMNSKNKCVVVAFTEPKKGTVVWKNPGISLFEYRTNWEMLFFEDFTGKVTLEED